tara:strand:+ start:803 stop:943 length:141 start_codon:yes stop_codon:yes gene_type:complete
MPGSRFGTGGSGKRGKEILKVRGPESLGGPLFSHGTVRVRKFVEPR